MCAYYRPDDADEPSLRKLEVSLQGASQIRNAYLLIGGDFNFPSRDWQTSLKTGYLSSQLHKDILDMINNNGLEEMVLESTRENNTLDLILTNAPQLIPRIEIVPGLSDHDILL